MRIQALRQKNNSRTKTNKHSSTVNILANTESGNNNAGNENSRKASAGGSGSNQAELNRMLNVKTGGDYEQGGAANTGTNTRLGSRKISIELDNLVQQHESHQSYIEKLKRMAVKKGNKTVRNSGSLGSMFNKEP